jgi:hypothetical protein
MNDTDKKSLPIVNKSNDQLNNGKYTQRAWDRIVGIGKVPLKYKHINLDKKSEKD